MPLFNRYGTPKASEKAGVRRQVLGGMLRDTGTLQPKALSQASGAPLGDDRGLQALAEKRGGARRSLQPPGGTMQIMKRNPEDDPLVEGPEGPPPRQGGYEPAPPPARGADRPAPAPAPAAPKPAPTPAPAAPAAPAPSTGRQALLEELESGEAKAQKAVDARAGLGGMGLYGGTAALKGDTARTHARSRALALSDFDRAEADEAREAERFEMEKRRATVEEYVTEEELGIDVNRDGFRGDPKDGIAFNSERDRRDERDDFRSTLTEVHDSHVFDDNTGGGTTEEPWLITQNDKREMEDLGFELTRVVVWGREMFRDQENNYYTIG